MRRLRLAVFWCHLAAGVFVGLVVLAMSATGVLLTYQRQLTAWADARALAAPPAPASAARVPLADILAGARAGARGAPTAVTWRARPGAPVEVAFGRERTLFVDGATGTVLGEGSRRTRAFFRTVTEWHRYLGAKGASRATGKGVTGAANLAFLFLVASGFYLWWPRSWAPGALRNVTRFRRGLGGRARDFNWHNVVGFWSAVPLFLVVLSGAVISYPWATALVYRAVGERAPAPAPPPAAAGAVVAPAAVAGIDALRARAEQRVPGWRSITLQLPADTARVVTFAVDRGTGGQPQARAQLTLDRATGREVRWEPFAAGTAGRRLRAILRFTHTGEVLGVAGQTVAGLVSLGAVVLVWTGLALSWRRLAAWRARRALVAAVPVRVPARAPRARRAG